MNAHEIASMVSIVLTLPTLTTSLTVVFRWWPNFRKTITNKESQKNPRDHLAVGIFTGFLKDFIDNGYWLIPWSLVLIDSQHASTWIMAGVFVNCFVRQGLGLAAARSHLIASEKLCRESGFRGYRISFLSSFVLGIVLGIVYLLNLIFNFYGT